MAPETLIGAVTTCCAAICGSREPRGTAAAEADSVDNGARGDR